MIIVVKVTDIQFVAASRTQVDYEARTSWGPQLTATLESDINSSLGQLAAKIRAEVITWAATISVTVKPAEVLVLGLSDDQISGVRKSSDDSTQSTAFTDVAGLKFSLSPNSHYRFKFKGAYTTAAGTTGIQLSVNGPAAPNFMRAVGHIFTGSGTVISGAIGAYDAAIAATAGGGSTPLPFEIEGTVSTGDAGGDFALRFRTEINNSAVTILRGSFGELISVG